MKLRKLLIIPFICSLLSCSGNKTNTDLYFVKQVDPNNNYYFVFNVDYTQCICGSANSIKYNSMFVNDNKLYFNETKNFGYFKDYNVLVITELFANYGTYTLGEYKLTDLKYEGGWRQ